MEIGFKSLVTGIDYFYDLSKSIWEPFRGQRELWLPKYFTALCKSPYIPSCCFPSSLCVLEDLALLQGELQRCLIN